jgi:poly-gamma-glutamate synthesis protein (capsule biosynthesis protein)
MRPSAALLTCALLLGACTPTPEPEPPPTTGPAPAPEPVNEAVLALGGDVMLARLVTKTLRAKGPRHVWGDVLPLLVAADVAIVNLECVIAEGGSPFEPPRVYTFDADPLAVEALTLAGIDGVSLANNHALDHRAPAMLECLGRLDDAGVAHAGAGRTRDDAARPALIETDGLRVALVGFADHFEEYGVTDERPGTNVIEVTTKGADFARVRASIDAARAAGPDLVVFSIHWGANFTERPSKEFREFAHAVIDAGADVFHGHSAHVFHGVEIYRGRPILYDTGDLLDDYAVDPFFRNDRQILFLVRVADGTIRRVEMVPVEIVRTQVNRARPSAFEFVARRMTELCEEFGTPVRRTDDRLAIGVAE